MKNILILCTGNSCRSQMAEGYLKHFAGKSANVFSAGIEAHGVNPKAIEVMKGDGINISQQTSNKVNEYMGHKFDYVITVCDNARENCPVFPSHAKMFHHDFPDPAKATGDSEQVMQAFRETRDMIKSYCRKFANENL